MSDDKDDDMNNSKACSDLFSVAGNKLFKTAKAMGNHEKSKKHKENLAALKLILQEEAEETSDSTSSDDSAIKCDRLNDTLGDTVDGHSDTEIDRHGETVDIHGDTGHDRLDDNDTHSDNAQHNTTNDELEDKIVTDKGADNDSVISDDEEDDILLLLAKNKTKQAPGYHGHKFESVSKETSSKPQDNTAQDESSKKAKGKKKKKSTNVKPASGDPSLLCHKCSREFPSRNKLFQHIKETGHALRTTNNTVIFISCHAN